MGAPLIVGVQGGSLMEIEKRAQHLGQAYFGKDVELSVTVERVTNVDFSTYSYSADLFIADVLVQPTEPKGENHD